MNRNKTQIKKQDGFTFVELGIVILIIGVLTVGVLKAVSPAIGDGQLHNTSNAISSLQASVSKLSMSGSYGTGDITPVLIAKDGIPSEFTVSGSTITHGFGGNITITGADKLSAINVTGLEQKTCIDLVTSNSASFVRVFVDTTAAAPGTLTTGGLVPPITAVQANTACAAATGNVIHFVTR